MPLKTQLPHFDAAANAFIERQLEAVEAEVYRQPYPEYKARLLIPVTHRVPAGAETVVYRTMDRVGVAQRIRSYSDNVPNADVSTKEDRSPVHGYGLGYGYSTQEVRAAQMAGMPLDSEKAYAAREGFEAAVENIAALGNGEGLVGLLNIPNANVYTVPADGTGSSALWSAKTGDLILRDLNGLMLKSIQLTNGIERANTVVLPEDRYQVIATTRLSQYSDTTILDFFLARNPGVMVAPWDKTKTAGAGGTARMVAYQRNPSKLRLEIPLEFLFHPAQEKGLGFQVPGEGRIAGVICSRPMAVTYGDGI